MRLALRLATLAVVAALRLPDRVIRAIVGPPVEVEGARTSPTAQLLIALERFVPRADPKVVPDLGAARRDFDIVSSVLNAGIARDVRTYDTVVPGARGPLRARVYGPPGASGPLPLMVFFHGGGFAIGSITSHDGICRFLSRHGGVRVVSVEYALAPEHPYPAAVDDAHAAFRHVVANAERFGGGAARVGVGGDSAGGALAAVVAQRCVDEAAPSPAFTLMLYPAVDGLGEHRSRQLFGRGYFLDSDMVDWYRSCYSPHPVRLHEPYASPLRAPDFRGLPPTCVVTAGFDPFRDEGTEYAERLRAAGVQVTHLHRDGLVHGFASFLGCDRHARAAMRDVAAELRRMAAGAGVGPQANGV
ncbi:alpha/beta hydrolase [Saccharothrix sp.]|uniref:alpha/beta hydrolase n=1 Tax=Saccharothrix sp. TaxID=1873460 RepID=UPI00281262A6|nr:alpha/beta hydrolase [Saccharothrix sp.]